MGDWALRWTEGNEMVQVFFVMLFFPVIMNALQYYIIDGFIKDQQPGGHEPLPTEDFEGRDDHDGDDHESTSWHSSTDLDDDRAAKEPTKAGSKLSATSKIRELRANGDEYDPERDGEVSPTAVGSGSASIHKDNDTSLGKGSLGSSRGS